MTVLEVATVEVVAGHEQSFEADLLNAAATVLPRSTGFIEFTAHGWSAERPSVYLFTIRWETLEDHLVGFREGELFAEWRAFIGPHFAQPPTVEHFAQGEQL